MVDKLEVRLDTMTPLRREFGAVLDEVRTHPRDYRAHETEHHALVFDLRPFGTDAIFHGYNKHKRAGEPQTHKLELLDTGEKKLGQIKSDLESVVACDPAKLEITRLDPCADVEEVPVQYFHQHMRVAYKRRGARVTEFMHVHQGEGETVYFGKRPNCFRVYNKTAELKTQYAKLLRELNADCPIPKHIGCATCGCLNYRTRSTCKRCYSRLPEHVKKQPFICVAGFERTYGISETKVLTRVERQIGGGMVPARIGTMGKLAVYAPDFDPFEGVHILTGREKLPPRHDYTFPKYECGLRLRELAKTMGLDYVRKYMRTHDPQNWRRTFRDLEPFFEVSTDEPAITADQLWQRYRDSVSRQLAA